MGLETHRQSETSAGEKCFGRCRGELGWRSLEMAKARFDEMERRLGCGSIFRNNLQPSFEALGYSLLKDSRPSR